MSCIFCNINKNEIVNQTENFYVKVGKGIITSGHIMIIPKFHYLAMAEIKNEIINEYLLLKKDTIKEVSKKFYEPFLIEYGIFGQSVFHAHIHIIPKSGNDYNNIDPFKEIIVEDAKLLNTEIIEIKNFKELQNFYKKYQQYIYFEDCSEKGYAIKVFDNMKNNPNYDFIGYRKFFTKIGLKGIDNWQKMTELDIKNDNAKIENTIKLMTKF